MISDELRKTFKPPFTTFMGSVQDANRESVLAINFAISEDERYELSNLIASSLNKAWEEKWACRAQA